MRGRCEHVFLLRISSALCVAAALAVTGRGAEPSLPVGINPDMLSGGLYAALTAQAEFAGPGTRPAVARSGEFTGPEKGRALSVLDARVGPNVRLGDDPAPLLATQRGQAEPHLARSVTDPDLLLATFQDGRFAIDGGAIGGGYALSEDGGFTWRRALIPQLTVASGGAYLRATDPVAGIGLQGELYLNGLATFDNAFAHSAIVLSRSFDRGATWLPPVVVAQSFTTTLKLDKNWMAVNDYTGAANAGRIAVTWTTFAGNFNYLQSAVSDDRGATWSAPANLTPTNVSAQGTQPVFLPDGALIVPSITFTTPNTSVLNFRIDAKVSADGGRTWPDNATVVVNAIAGWDDPELREGVFLIGATVARTAGDVWVCYTAMAGGSPRIFAVKSSDRGATWAAPVVVSNNPAGVSVMNPAIVTTPDGRGVTVMWMDRRHSTAALPVVDHYAALSHDGGATWSPALRLSDRSSDIRNAAPTNRGYMFGDYLGLVGPLGPEQPAVALWCDTRTGDADPFATRFAPMASAGFEAWRIAQFNRAELADAARSGAAADPDGDGYANLIEYAHGTAPRTAEGGSGLLFSTGQFGVALGDRWAAGRGDVTRDFETSSDGVRWTPALANPAAIVAPPAQGLFDAPAGRPTFFRATYSLGATTLYSPDAPVAHGDARLVNLATRGAVKTGGAQLIAGVVTTGGSLPLLVRAIGPTLGAFGLASALADPQLALFRAGETTAVATNDDWSDGTAFARVGAFGLPVGSKDAALVFTAAPAAGGYSAVVSGAGGQSGVGLVEIYDLAAGPGALDRPRLINVATRGEVSPGTLLIAGFVIGGTQPRRVLIRAAGPAIAALNVAQALADPQLALFRGATLVAENDDWSRGRHAAAVAATGLGAGAFVFAADSLDAALLVTLAPGAYTAVVTGVGEGSGVALVEVYDVN